MTGQPSPSSATNRDSVHVQSFRSSDHSQSRSNAGAPDPANQAAQNVREIDKHDEPFLALPTRLFEDVFSDPYDRRSAFAWLIAHAARRERCICTRAGNIKLSRGQVLAGSDHLATAWGWSRKQVRSYLSTLVDRGWLTKGPTAGQYASTFFIVGFDRYQRAGAARASDCATDRSGDGPGRGQTHNPKSGNFVIEDSRGRSAVPLKNLWGLPIEGPDADVAFDGRTITLRNGERAEWLKAFGGDEQRLEFALMQAAPFIQLSSNRPLIVQVRQHLARAAAEKADRDQRYEKAATQRADKGADAVPRRGNWLDDRNDRARSLMSSNRKESAP